MYNSTQYEKLKIYLKQFHDVTSRHVTSRHVTSRHVTSFILNFIQNYVYIIYLSFVKYSYSFLISIQTTKSLWLKPAFSERILFALQKLIVKMFLNYSENLLTIYIKNSYLKKLFIRLNISIYILIKTINCYFAIFTYKVRLLFVCQNKLKFLFQGEKNVRRKQSSSIKISGRAILQFVREAY